MPDARVTHHRRALLDIPTWCAAAWVVLATLVAWGYGANNVALPGVPVPFVDLALVVLLVRSRRWWSGFAASGIGRTLRIALVALAAVVALRLAVDVPRHSLDAVRGAIFAFEAWAVFVGAAIARRVGRDRTIELLGLVFTVALAWYCLYPFRSTIAGWSPTVGVRHPTPLFSFTRMGLIGAWGLLWFGLRRSTASLVGVIVAIGVVILAQSRGTTVGLLGALGVVAVAASRGHHVGARSRLLRRIAIGGALGVAFIVAAPAMRGRLGEVSIDTYVDLARSAVGRDTRIASSFDDRVEWIDTTVQAIEDTRLGWLSGVGFGVDLTGDFGVAGTDVVNPHNDLLEFYARLGVFVLPWVAMWAVTLREFWRRSRRGDRIALWGVGAWVSMVAGSLTQPFNSFAYGGMVWWMLVGLVLGSSASEATPGDPTVVAGGVSDGDTDGVDPTQPGRRDAISSP